jgi:membrane-bound inhibitor of C-type lysozyme
MRPGHFLVIGIAAAVLGQAPAWADTFTTYHCRDGSQFVVAFYERDSAAHLQLDGKAVTLRKRPSVSGARYVAGGVTLKMTKTAVTLQRGKRTTDCSI